MWGKVIMIHIWTQDPSAVIQSSVGGGGLLDLPVVKLL